MPSCRSLRAVALPSPRVDRTCGAYDPYETGDAFIDFTALLPLRVRSAGDDFHTFPRPLPSWASPLQGFHGFRASACGAHLPGFISAALPSHPESPKGDCRPETHTQKPLAFPSETPTLPEVSGHLSLTIRCMADPGSFFHRKLQGASPPLVKSASDLADTYQGS